MNRVRISKKSPQSSTAEPKKLVQSSGKIQYLRRPYELAGGGTGVLTAGYRRWLEFDERDHPGQDFAGYRVDGHHAVGVVVDGVSQSFHGQIAAQEVGDHLLDVLWQGRSRPPEAAELGRGLLKLAEHVQKELNEKPLPEKALLRQALEEARKDGSQAVFSAFVLDTKAKRADVYQIGDVVSWVFRGSGAPERIDSDPRGRWSSVARVSEVDHSRFQDVRGILLHSDGMAATTVDGLTGAEIDQETFRAQADERAGLDDVSFVGFSVEPGEAVGGTGEADQPEPRAGRRLSRTVKAAAVVVFLLGLGAGATLADLMGMDLLGKEPGAAGGGGSGGESGQEGDQTDQAAEGAETGVLSPQGTQGASGDVVREAPIEELRLEVARSTEGHFETSFAAGVLPEEFMSDAAKENPGQIVARIECDAQLSPCELRVTVDGRLPRRSYRVEGSGQSKPVVHFVLLPGLSDVDSGYKRIPRELEIQVTGNKGTWKVSAILDGREIKDDLDPEELQGREPQQPFWGYHLLTLTPADSGS